MKKFLLKYGSIFIVVPSLLVMDITKKQYWVMLGLTLLSNVWGYVEGLSKDN